MRTRIPFPSNQSTQPELQAATVDIHLHHHDPLRSEHEETVLYEHEHQLLSSVEAELAKGLALARWWQREGGKGPNAQRFELIANERGEGAYGIHQQANVPGLGNLLVNAAVQKIPFTRPKPRVGEERDAADWTGRQIREFALRYFLRSTGYADAQSYPDLGQAPLPTYLRLFGWCPVEGLRVGGTVFRQMYFKRDGRVGKFTRHERQAIIDLRTIGPIFDWVVLAGQVFDASMSFSLSHPNSPKLSLPLQREIYMILTPELVFDQSGASSPEGALGRFGSGYIFLEHDPTRLGSFSPAFETIVFQVSELGETEMHMALVARKPGLPVRISVNPERMRALLTGTMSQDDIMDEFLYEHLLEQRALAFNSLKTWNLVPDWLDQSKLPPWLLPHGAETSSP
ncbi:MAG: hypothetical protein AAF560_25535 [Acidobacteriota bacterium]